MSKGDKPFSNGAISEVGIIGGFISWGLDAISELSWVSQSNCFTKSNIEVGKASRESLSLQPEF